MKIQMGKLSTSNAVVIGVLVAVLYFVIPTGSQKKRQISELAPEQTTQASGKSEAPTDTTVQQKTTGSTSDTRRAILSDKLAEINLRAIEEIDENLLAVLSGRDPFRTTAITKDAGTVPEETQAADTEVRDILRDTLEAQKHVRSAKISLIYSSSTGKKAAIVNDEIVYPGSRISGHYLVETVQPNGLELRTGAVPLTQSP